MCSFVYFIKPIHHREKLGHMFQIILVTRVWSFTFLQTHINSWSAVIVVNNFLLYTREGCLEKIVQCTVLLEKICLIFE